MYNRCIRFCPIIVFVSFTCFVFFLFIWWFIYKKKWQNLKEFFENLYELFVKNLIDLDRIVRKGHGNRFHSHNLREENYSLYIRVTRPRRIAVNFNLTNLNFIRSEKVSSRRRPDSCLSMRYRLINISQDSVGSYF